MKFCEDFKIEMRFNSIIIKFKLLIDLSIYIEIQLMNPTKIHTKF